MREIHDRLNSCVRYSPIVNHQISYKLLFWSCVRYRVIYICHIDVKLICMHIGSQQLKSGKKQNIVFNLLLIYKVMDKQ